MLLQSRDNTIYLLPALPDAWVTGSVSGLVARGAIETRIAWENGNLSYVCLKAKNATMCKVSYRSCSKSVALRPGAWKKKEF